MTKILLSIHPRHGEAILDGRGTKLFEFRRALPARQPTHVVLYETAPVCRIVGEFEVARILADWPLDDLWAETERHAGIDRDEFERYFNGRATGHAIEVFRATRYATPIDPRLRSDIVFTPPQSFCYWPPRLARSAA